MAVLQQLSPQERRAARVLFGRLVALSTSYAVVPAPQPWRIVSTLNALQSIDAIALRDRLARGGVIDMFRGEALEFGKGSAETMIGLTRPNPAPYQELDGGKADLRFMLWRDPTYARAVRWKADDPDALLRGSALAEARDWLATRQDELTGWEREFIQASERANEDALAREREREAAEQATREERERERRQAAEALAAEQGERLKVEQAASARLKRGRAWLQGLFAVSTALAVVAIMLFVQAQGSAKLAQAEQRSAELARERAESALASFQSVLDSANAARIAAENALQAQTAQARQAATVQLAATRATIAQAQTNVSNLEKGCPVGQRFYLHIASEHDREPARALIPEFEERGFIVPGIQLVRDAPRASAVRYFRREEEKAAFDAAALLENLGIRQIKPAYIAGYENSKDIRPCHYEVWFTADAFRR
jgi:hypothetical protein